MITFPHAKEKPKKPLIKSFMSQLAKSIVGQATEDAEPMTQLTGYAKTKQPGGIKDSDIHAKKTDCLKTVSIFLS